MKRREFLRKSGIFLGALFTGAFALRDKPVEIPKIDNTYELSQMIKKGKYNLGHKGYVKWTTHYRSVIVNKHWIARIKA